jgi:hypothetical protein
LHCRDLAEEANLAPRRLGFVGGVGIAPHFPSIARLAGQVSATMPFCAQKNMFRIRQYMLRILANAH